MENKRITNLQEKVSKNIEILNNIKVENDFNAALKEYKGLNSKVKKYKHKLKQTDDASKVSEYEEKIKEYEKQKSEILPKLKPVDAPERNLFKIKQEIDSTIKSIDSKKNSVDSTIKSIEFKLSDIEKALDDKYKTELEKEITSLEKDIETLKKTIEVKRENKQTTKVENTEINIINSKIRDIKSSIVKIEKSNKDKLQTEQAKLSEDVKTHKEQSDLLQKEITTLIDLTKKINNTFSFIDSSKETKNASFIIEHLDVWYGPKQALFNVNLVLPRNKVISIIGPSGCGKSTLLRTLNRINDNIPSFKANGKILLDGEYDIFKLKSIRNRYDKMELSTLRTKVGMIFQQPNPFPMSIYKNVVYGPKLRGIKNKSILNDLTEKSLKEAGLWEEVKDNLKALGTSLSGGQQQRLCIARAVANSPEVLLMDEPTSALDPIAAKKVEDLILKLKEHYTVIMVTHSMQQAQRISDYTAFMYQGKMVEYGETKQVFTKPKEQETKEYISGKFG